MNASEGICQPLPHSKHAIPPTHRTHHCASHAIKATPVLSLVVLEAALLLKHIPHADMSARYSTGMHTRWGVSRSKNGALGPSQEENLTLKKLDVVIAEISMWDAHHCHILSIPREGVRNCIQSLEGAAVAEIRVPLTGLKGRQESKHLQTNTGRSSSRQDSAACAHPLLFTSAVDHSKSGFAELPPATRQLCVLPQQQKFAKSCV